MKVSFVEIFDFYDSIANCQIEHCCSFENILTFLYVITCISGLKFANGLVFTDGFVLKNFQLIPSLPTAQISIYFASWPKDLRNSKIKEKFCIGLNVLDRIVTLKYFILGWKIMVSLKSLMNFLFWLWLYLCKYQLIFHFISFWTHKEYSHISYFVFCQNFY